MNSFPPHITFLSCKSECELVSEIKGTKERMAEYKYTRVNPKGILEGKTVTLALVQIDRLFSAHLIKIE